MAKPAQPLVGRAAELRSLDVALIELSRGRSGAIEIEGEPGIGKTRLLAELGARAEQRGHAVLSGSASEFEHELPFWVFADALDEYVQAVGPGPLAHLDGNTNAELAHVLPSLGEHGGPTEALHGERYRMHRAVRRLLEALAARKPLTLVLDDLHWADSGSIELLGSLLRHPPAAPVLIAVGLRPRQAPERLSAALVRAHRAGTLSRLELGALSAEESGQLLGGTVSGGVAAALHEEGGGNPFYIQQLARALDRRLGALRSASAVSLAGVDVPRAVVGALTEELALLDTDARRLLSGAAVAGDPFEPELAAAAAALPEAAAMQALDELLQRDLVRLTDVPRRFRFRHPLLRQAVYEAASGGWRIGAHERSAEALAARGASAVVRAHHVEQAARHGDEAAIAVLREAGEATADRTPAGAARWFGAALRLLPWPAPAEQRISLLAAMARSLAAAGQFNDARAALIEAVAIAPADPVGRRVELAGACAAIEQLLGRHDEAQARLLAALESLEDAASSDAATLMVDLAAVAFYRVEFERSCRWASRALEIAEPLGDRPITAAATAILALSSALAGARVEADRRCDQAAELVDAMPDAELARRLDAAAHLAGAEGYVERYAAAAEHGRRGLAVARRTGQGELAPILVPALATVMLGLGRVAEGAEFLDGAVEGARLTDNAQALAFNLFNRALMSMLAGDHDAALEHAEESVQLAGGLEAGVISAWAGTILGFILVERGDAARGVETMLRSGGGDGMPLIGGGWRAWCLDRLADGWLALGRRADAQRAAAAARVVADTTGLRHPAAMAHRAAARVALDAGDPVGAAEHALASAAAGEEIGARLEVGLSRTIAGRALARSGRPERATEQLERAADELEACGALRYRAEAERELGKLGRRRHRRTRAQGAVVGVASLTERELEVARLIVDRRTNAQIAAELYLSRKTVESHVRNLFHKLAVSSRVEVARAIERAGHAAD